LRQYRMGDVHDANNKAVDAERQTKKNV
jgi:hypothetical protein